MPPVESSLDAELLDERAGERQQAGFVGKRKEGAGDFHGVSPGSGARTSGRGVGVGGTAATGTWTICSAEAAGAPNHRAAVSTASERSSARPRPTAQRAPWNVVSAKGGRSSEARSFHGVQDPPLYAAKPGGAQRPTCRPSHDQPIHEPMHRRPGETFRVRRTTPPRLPPVARRAACAGCARTSRSGSARPRRAAAGGRWDIPPRRVRSRCRRRRRPGRRCRWSVSTGRDSRG